MKTLRLDNSLMKTIAKCSTKAVLHELGFGGGDSIGAMETGTIFHEVIANHIHGISVADNIDHLRYRYEEFPTVFTFEQLEEFPRYRLDNLEIIAAEWINRNPVETLPIHFEHPDHVEVMFEHPVDEVTYEGETYLLAFTGQLDGIGTDADGNLYVWENKTTGRLYEPWKRQFQADPQNTGYMWAAEQTLGRPVLGSYINAIEISKVPRSNRKCFQGHRGEDGRITTYEVCGPRHVNSEIFLVHRSPELIDQWRKDFLFFAKRYLELQRFINRGIKGATQTRTQGKFTDSCVYCNYWNWCIGSGRNPSMAEQMLVKSTHIREVKVGLECSSD